MAMDPNQFTAIPAAPPKKRGWGRLALGCGGTIGVLILLVVGAFVWQMMQAGNLMRTAQEKRAAGDYEGAVKDMMTLIADYSSFDESKEAQAQLPQVRMEWAAALRDQGKFEDSLARYDEVSDPTLQQDVATGKLETRLGWGKALIGEKQFDKGREQLETVLAEAPEAGDLATQATAALPDAYVGLADQSAAAGDVATAFQHLNYVFTNYQTGPGLEKAGTSLTAIAQPLYDLTQQQKGEGKYADAESVLKAITTHAPTAPVAAQIESEFPAFYLAWGKGLFDAQMYPESAEVYTYLINNYPNSELLPQAEAGLVDAEVAAVAASGQAGALPQAEAAGNSGGELAAYDVTNDTVCPIIVLMSGPQSQALRLDPQANRRVDLPAGTYQVVVKINEDMSDSDACQNVTPFTGPSTFDSGMLYSSSFYIETSSN